MCAHVCMLECTCVVSYVAILKKQKMEKNWIMGQKPRQRTEFGKLCKTDHFSGNPGKMLDTEWKRPRRQQRQVSGWRWVPHTSLLPEANLSAGPMMDQLWSPPAEEHWLPLCVCLCPTQTNLVHVDAKGVALLIFSHLLTFWGKQQSWMCNSKACEG